MGQLHASLFVGLTWGSIVGGLVLSALALWGAVTNRKRTKKRATERLLPAWLKLDHADEQQPAQQPAVRIAVMPELNPSLIPDSHALLRGS